MSKLVDALTTAELVMRQRIDRQQHERELMDLHEGWKNRERELLAHIERLQAQLAEAKNLFLHERTEGLTDQEQLEAWDDAEEYFERQMALTAQQADKGE